MQIWGYLLYFFWNEKQKKTGLNCQIKRVLTTSFLGHPYPQVVQTPHVFIETKQNWVGLISSSKQGALLFC